MTFGGAPLRFTLRRSALSVVCPEMLHAALLFCSGGSISPRSIIVRPAGTARESNRPAGRNGSLAGVMTGPAGIGWKPGMLLHACGAGAKGTNCGAAEARRRAAFRFAPPRGRGGAEAGSGHGLALLRTEYSAILGSQGSDHDLYASGNAKVLQHCGGSFG